MAFNFLKGKGRKIFPVNQGLKKIDGHPIYPSLVDLPDKVDTLTLYLSPEISAPLANQIITAKPRQVIFNPGTESMITMDLLRKQGLAVVPGCALVILWAAVF
jgi:predicted CoA-binding protein